MFGGVGGRRRTEKDPVTERADSLSSSPPPPDRRRRGGTSEDDDGVVYDFYDDDDETTKKTMETQMEKMKRKMHLLQQELRAKDDMLEAVQSQAKLDIVNARTRVDSIEEKREELEARCAKAEKLALERTNALETANKKVKEAERSAKVFMQRANAKISEALRENSSNTISKDAAENRELKNASSSSPSKIDRKLTPSNLSLQEKILRIEERQQMEDEEGLMSIHNNNNNTATTTTSSSSPLVAANDNRVIKQNEEDKEEDKSNKEQTDMNQKQIEESLRNEIQQLLTQNADAARSFQDSLEIERNKRREAEERAEMSEAACVRLQSELRSKESLLKMMETTRSTGDKSETTALRARILNDEVEANATSASPPTTAKIEQVLQKIQRPRRKEGKEEESDDDDNDDDDDDDDEIPSFSPVKPPPPPPRKY